MAEQVLQKLTIGGNDCPGRIVIEATTNGPQMTFYGVGDSVRMVVRLQKDGTPSIEQKGHQRMESGEIDKLGGTTITMNGWQSLIQLSDSQGKPSLRMPPDKITTVEQWDRIWAKLAEESRGSE